MTDDRSLERAARSWLEVGPTQAPDRAVDAALLLIQTTSQERDLRIPWRLPKMTPTTRLATAAGIGVLVVGVAFFAFGRSNSSVAGPGESPTPSPAPTATPSPTPSASPAADYSDLPGRILLEHFGNAPDGSETGTGNNYDRRRFYLMDPATMTGATAREFLPTNFRPGSWGQMVADVSRDGTRVVFQDTTDKSRNWQANLDGSGLRELRSTCDCIEGDPAYDPTGTRIAYVHIEGDQSWIGIRDLATGAITIIESTRGPSVDAVAGQPTWSPDGSKIAFQRITWAGSEYPKSGVISIVDLATRVVADLPIPGTLIPGEPDWSPDGTLIVFTAGPLDSTGGVQRLPHDVYTIRPDGTGQTRLTNSNGAGGASFTPDGKHILYSENFQWLMNPDGSDQRPVNANGMDLTSSETGFAYTGHWIDTP